MVRRRFEFKQGRSSKFWECWTDENTVTCRWGRIGTAGQSKSWLQSDAESAEDFARKKVREKVGKGYREVQQDPVMKAVLNASTPKPNTPKSSTKKVQSVKPEVTFKFRRNRPRLR